MVRPGKGLTNYLGLRTNRPNKKQNSSSSITDDFRELLKKFDNSPYLYYKSKQVHN